MNSQTELDQICVNTLRSLSIDAVEKARSGHPGTPMGAAPYRLIVFGRNFYVTIRSSRLAQSRPFHTFCRSRFSTALQSPPPDRSKGTSPSDEGKDRLAVTMEDLKTFRQAGSRCTGHPEYGWTSGSGNDYGTAGPGRRNQRWMAIAERWLAATYNRPDFELFNHKFTPYAAMAT